MIGAASAGVGFGVGSVASGIVTSMLSNALGETGAGFIGGVAGGAAGGAAAGAMSAGLYRVAGYDLDIGQATWMGAAIGGGIAFVSEAAWLMRKEMVAQSRLDPRNANGKSAGVRNDNFKLAGCRAGCTKPSLLGGYQSGLGSFFGKPYNPGSFLDRLLESYAGAHDFFNSPYWYDALGNIKQGITGLKAGFGQFLNYFNVIPATPFAVSTLAQPYMTAVIPGFTSVQERSQGVSGIVSVPYGQPVVSPTFRSDISSSQSLCLKPIYTECQ